MVFAISRMHDAFRYREVGWDAIFAVEICAEGCRLRSDASNFVGVLGNIEDILRRMK